MQLLSLGTWCKISGPAIYCMSLFPECSGDIIVNSRYYKDTYIFSALIQMKRNPSDPSMACSGSEDCLRYLYTCSNFNIFCNFSDYFIIWKGSWVWANKKDTINKIIITLQILSQKQYFSVNSVKPVLLCLNVPYSLSLLTHWLTSTKDSWI